MDLLRLLLKMKAPGDRKSDFERFRQAITSNKPAPAFRGQTPLKYLPVGSTAFRPVLIGNARACSSEVFEMLKNRQDLE